MSESIEAFTEKINKLYEKLGGLRNQYKVTENKIEKLRAKKRQLQTEASIKKLEGESKQK
ncbi:hypothetical protein LCGC14_0145700 [marine sediment metagenome]|uniref:Uncharacterized protein n=1 Tax=marine sediment metagenome TaxID=412755 RepID=A0A0F9V3A7_9ZZZZ